MQIILDKIKLKNELKDINYNKIKFKLCKVSTLIKFFDCLYIFKVYRFNKFVSLMMKLLQQFFI